MDLGLLLVFFMGFLRTALAKLSETHHEFPEEASSVVILGSSVALFGAVYGLGVAKFYKSWKSQRRRHEVASSTISVVHGTVVTAVAVYEIATTAAAAAAASGSGEAIMDAWLKTLASPNTRLQSAVMEFSVGYFLVDLAHYLFYARDDYLFILHHIATSSYMLSCRYGVRHGAESVMAMLAVGEATSPLQNIWSICRMGRDGSPAMKKIYELLSPIFTVAFTGFRVVIGPALVWKLSRFYLAGGADGVVPRWLVACWMGKSSLALVGSLVWVYKLWAGLARFYGAPGGLKAKNKKLAESQEEQEDEDAFLMNPLDQVDSSKLD